MIELNLTYEESKKILELGYDFRKICTKFEVKTDIEYQVCYGAIITSDKWNRVEIESSRVIQDEGKLEHGQRIAFNPLSIPIIPKAALEACLKIDLPTHSQYSYRYFEKCCGDDDIDLEGSKNLIKFNSAFEAFLWCHENYPEELKAKFDEVMA
jgi:hypothetical protein